MSDVFLSYATGDREVARTLAAALQVEGWSVWWDRDIRVGQAYDQVIERELDSARCVVVLWSAASIASEWVKNEAASAAERGVLVPALIGNVRPPLEFRRRQTANLTGWDGDISAAGFQALCGGIAGITGTAAALVPAAAAKPKTPVRLTKRKIASLGILAGLIAAGAYLGLRAYRGSQPEASLPGMPAGAGVLDFPWPGSDCWEILRGENKAAWGCGAASQALESGDYTIKPASNSPFLPLRFSVKPNQVAKVDAAFGVADFRWPGSDCWEVYRQEAKAAWGCGAGKQALQTGRYTIKPVSNSVFLPLPFTVKADQVLPIDAMGGVLEFHWPGPDCWEAYRQEAKAAWGCGSGKQALQAGAYTMKPASGNAFQPFRVVVKRGATVTAP